MTLSAATSQDAHAANLADLPAGLDGSAKPDNGSWAMLALLSTAFLISAVDRQILALLVEPIKADLRLSDSEIGALQGFAFLLIYATAALPAGIMVDRLHRGRLIAGAMSLWSLMTGACGLASSFTSLFAARAGVAVGEAALTPAGYSLIADRFPHRLHARAFGLYHTGSALGAGLAYFVGGYLFISFSKIGRVELPIVGSMMPWQMTFVVLTLPGLVVASLFLFLREQRSAVKPPVGTMGRRDLLPQAWRVFAKRYWRLLLLHHVGVGFCYIAMMGSASWTAAYFVRVYAFPLEQVGLWLGSAAALGGIIGLLGGGVISDYLFRYGAHMRLAFCTAVCVAGSVAALGFVLTDSPMLCIIFFLMQIVCSAIPVSTGNAALQYITPSSVRGTVSAVFFFSISLVGSPSPSLIGWLNDHMFPQADGIRTSMGIVIPAAFLLAAILFFFSSRIYPRED